MSKESRITIRTTAELDAWLAAEADANGLDKAAFARMVLFRAMNGRAEFEAKALNPLMAVPQAEEAHAADVDIDAMVAQRLTEAAASGKLHARADLDEPEEIDPAMAELGMRPFRIAPPPHFGDKSPRIQRSSTWAPGGR